MERLFRTFAILEDGNAFTDIIAKKAEKRTKRKMEVKLGTNHWMVDVSKTMRGATQIYVSRPLLW
jgi:hypothetical protein